MRVRTGGDSLQRPTQSTFSTRVDRHTTRGFTFINALEAPLLALKVRAVVHMVLPTLTLSL
jgi:hypothetical protein